MSSARPLERRFETRVLYHLGRRAEWRVPVTSKAIEVISSWERPAKPNFRPTEFLRAEYASIGAEDGGAQCLHSTAGV